MWNNTSQQLFNGGLQAEKTARRRREACRVRKLSREIGVSKFAEGNNQPSGPVSDVADAAHL
jgi:hypothetical protein